MLVDNIDDFIKCIPTALGTKWETIQSYMIDAENEMVLLSFGEDLIEKITSLENDPARLIANHIQCLLAYHHAIPFLDVIQTTNGFAVVNSSNLAPASKERVERLIEKCESQINFYTDLLITNIRDKNELLAEWKKFGNYNSLNNCIFATGEEFARHADVVGSKRAFFLQVKSQIESLQLTMIAPVISADYLNQLITEVRNNNYTPGTAVILNLCQKAIGSVISGKNEIAVDILNEILRIMNNNLETYTVYASSTEYKARNKVYVNKQSDSTFVFGL